jgi:hypothetical protein
MKNFYALREVFEGRSLRLFTEIYETEEDVVSVEIKLNQITDSGKDVYYTFNRFVENEEGKEVKVGLDIDKLDEIFEEDLTYMEVNKKQQEMTFRTKYKTEKVIVKRRVEE